MNMVKKNKKLISVIIVSMIIVFGSLSIIDCSMGKSCIGAVVSVVIGDDSSAGKVSEEGKALNMVELVSVSELDKSNSVIKITGQVESVDQVELKSQVSARVNKMYVKIGDEVSDGQVLLVFDNSDAYAQVLQARANRDAAKATLNEIITGASSEQLNLSNINYANAVTMVADAQTNLDNAKNKAIVDINSAYSSALNLLISSANIAKNSLLAGIDIQTTYYTGSDFDAIKIRDAKGEAVNALFGEPDAKLWGSEFVSELDGGVYGFVNTLTGDMSHAEIDSALKDMQNAMLSVRNFLNAIPYRADLIGDKNMVTGQLTAISSAEQGILMQKAANTSIISGAESALNGAKSALAVAEGQLKLTESGSTVNQIAAAKARLSLADAGVLSAETQFLKTIIKAPTAGIISVLPVRVGELVSPGTPVASVVNTQSLEIKAFVDGEIIPDIKVGSSVSIEDKAKGVVARVSPGVNPATKKVEVVVAVENPDESGLIVGQFVNVDISVNSESVSDGDGTYLIPLEAIKTTTQGKYVYTVNKDGEIEINAIEIAKIIGERAQVTSGIMPDMKIIKDVRGLSEGQKIQVI